MAEPLSQTTDPSPRAVAVAALDAVLAHGRPLDRAFEDQPQTGRLTARDRAFSLNLVATTLRRLGQIDVLLSERLPQPLPLQARAVRQILRLGAAQLLFLATPAHAAVDTAVRLSKQLGFDGFASLVNAVLRRLASDGAARLEEQDAARLNTPDWLWTSWQAAYGEETARRIALANLAEPPLDLTARADPAAVAARLGARLLPTGTVRLPASTPVAALPGYQDGAWWVQDAAAALPVRALGTVDGQHVIDLCAAPGGKTAQLAAAGARVVAVDRSKARMRRLAENLARLHLSAETVVADASRWRPREPADAVLLDAPCTATGTIRRHPDVAHIKSAGDVATLAAVQDRLLAAAMQMLRPGGRLVYCACSLQPEEGPERIAALVAAVGPAEREPISADEMAGLSELLTPEGDLRTLPSHLATFGGMDGFYAARLVRR